MRVRKAREGKIMRAQQKISRAFNESRIGSVCEVLVEGREENGLYYGRSQWEAPETDARSTSSSPKGCKRAASSACASPTRRTMT